MPATSSRPFSPVTVMVCLCGRPSYVTSSGALTLKPEMSFPKTVSVPTSTFVR